MFIFVSVLIQLTYSQTPVIKVSYNSRSFSFYYSELNVNNLKSTFKILDLECLEDLSGKTFYPFISGGFPPSISSEVYVRQRPPVKVPTYIYPTESKIINSNSPWLTAYHDIGSGYHHGAKHMRISFINFKDLSAINLKKKIYKVYLRLIGYWSEFTLPTQVFAHRIETEWQGIINWTQQPIIREEASSFRIVTEAYDIVYLWDVTDIVLEWTSGLLPNYGIAIKSNNTFGISTAKNYYGIHAVKAPALLVYYSD